MGIAIPQVVTESKASGAQIIDGSLKFDFHNQQYLERTFGSTGNRRTFTYSFWIKRGAAGFGAFPALIFSGANNVTPNMLHMYFGGSNSEGLVLYSLKDNSNVRKYATIRQFKDPNSWYHIVVAIDSTISAPALDRMKIYVNGEKVTNFASSDYNAIDLNTEFTVSNSGQKQLIGLMLNSSGSKSTWYDGMMSQYYFIDGLALGPGYFGYTDPLTNTWRPRKFRAEGTTVNDGRVFSSTGTFSNWDDDGSYPKTELFDGTLYEGGTPNGGCPDDGNPASFDFGDQRITGFQNLQINIFISSNQASGTNLASVNGVDITPEIHQAGNNTWTIVDLGNKFTSLQSFSIANNNCYVGGFIIDGVVMQDSTTQNLDFGTNGSYLPMDGSASVGQDQSGKGNDFTTFAFGGSVPLDSPAVSGARPILDTIQGGTQAAFGVFGSKENKNLTVTVSNATGSNKYYLDSSPTSVDYSTVTLSGLSPSSFNQTYVRQSTGFVLDTGTVSSGNALFHADSNYYYYVASTGSYPEDRMLIYSVEDAKWVVVFDFNDPDYREGNVSNNQAIGSSGIFTTDVTASGTTGDGRNVPTASSDIVYSTGAAELNPTLAFIRGATITFNTTDSSNNSHPFKLSSTNADSSGGTEYTDGVKYFINGSSVSGSDYVSNYATNSGGTGFRGIKWTVPHNVSTTYYYCTSHTGMGNNGRLNSTTDETKADPYAWKCVTALPLAGGVGDLSGDLNCTTTSKTWTANDATPSNLSNFYNGSFNFDGAGDNVESADNADYAFGTGDLTIEMWVYLDSLVGTLWDSGAVNSNNNCAIFIDGTYLYWYMKPGNDLGVSHTTSGLKTGKWNHLAFVRSGTTAKIYLNGQEIESDTNASNVTADKGKIGVLTGFVGTYDLDGQVQDVRVYKGLAKYTSEFTPASIDSDVILDSPSGVTAKSELTKITDGSFASPESHGPLQVQDDDDLAFGTGQFTVECFFYTNTTSGNDVLYDSRAATGSTPVDGFSIVRTSNQLTTYSGGYKIQPSSFRVESKRWYHLAITRDSTDSTTQKMYVDGKLVGTVSFNNNLSQPKATIGSDVNGSEAWDGYISSFRIIKGSALYTSDFTPPSVPLTNVTNTKLLCCQSTTSHTAAAVIPDVTQFPAPYSAVNRFDSIKYYTTVKQNQTSGTTLPMSNPAHYQGNALDLSSGGFQITTVNSATEDFFMGMWVHFDTYETGKQFGVDIAGNYVYFELQSSGAVKIRHTGDGGSTSSATSLNDGSWHHIALSRTNDTLYGFVDGTAVVNDNGGTGGNSVSENCKFNFWGADNNFTSYNIDGQIIDAFIYIGQGVSSYTTPSAPLVGNDGTINHFSGFSDTQAYYISPCVDVTGSTANSLSGFFKNKAGDKTGTASNFNPFNTDVGTVRGQETNYATLNPLANAKFQSKTLKNGNLDLSGNNAESSGYPTAFSNFVMNGRGKWYMEAIAFNTTDTNGVYIGLCDKQMVDGLGVTVANTYPGGPGGVAYAANGTIADNGSNPFTGQPTYTAGDVISVAYDADNGKVYFAKNGVYLNGANPVTGDNPHDTGRTGDQFFVVGAYGNRNVTTNFGQKLFKFPPPKGYRPLTNVNSLPDVVIANSSQYVGVTTYAATGSDDITKSDLNHQPDFLWIKPTNNSGQHTLTDSVRGVTWSLKSDSTNGQEERTGNNSKVKSFNINGFTIGTNNDVNNTGDYVAWSWKAGGNKDTFNINDEGYSTAAAAGITGLDGTDQLTTAKFTGCSIGTEQGFSIIKYIGVGGGNTLVPHGLTQTPDMVIVKNLDETVDWAITHSGLPGNRSLRFTTADTSTSGFLGLNKGGLTSTHFTVNYSDTNANYVNSSNDNFIAYCWHSVPGLQKFGTYEGIGGTADGAFVELGFRPAIVWVKNIDTNNSNCHWCVFDNLRPGINKSPAQNRLHLDADSQEDPDRVDDGQGIDILSNGFKVRSNNWYETNLSGSTYIYCAWAETPQSNLFGGQANAR